MKSDIAVSIKNVKKSFHLPHDKEDSIKLKILNSFKQNKNKGHDVYRALKGIDIEIKKGEFVGILGRNGAGKSTLLKIIAEIYQPTSGSVKVNGRLVPFIELGVGFNPNLTGRDNVFLNGAMLGFSRKEIEKMYDSIVEFAELEEFMDQKLKNYSSGQRVRLAFSMAIRADADILLLDEVLAVGDAAFQKKCYEYFDSLRENKKTIILVSHGMGVIRQYCDKAILIEDGKVAFEGTADQVADEYLKLFNQSTINSKSQESKDRWGDEAIKIKQIDLKVVDDTIKITTILKAAADIRDVKFGFRIKDTKGNVLIGANNLNVEGNQKLHFKSGEAKELEFLLPNILGNQRYTLSATVNSKGDVVHDSWENISTISNSREGVYYPLLAPATLRVKEGK